MSQASAEPVGTKAVSGPPGEPLTAGALARAARLLARRDPDLARVRRTHGDPPLWPREPGFAALVHIILEQQVSLASAQAAFDRLTAACRGRTTPRRVLALTPGQLARIGFSRQKAAYAHELAGAIVSRRFAPAALATLDDRAAREALVALRGVGPWSADVYLLMCLRRPDVWPSGDLALASAVPAGA